MTDYSDWDYSSLLYQLAMNTGTNERYNIVNLSSNVFHANFEHSSLT